LWCSSNNQSESILDSWSMLDCEQNHDFNCLKSGLVWCLYCWVWVWMFFLFFVSLGIWSIFVKIIYDFFCFFYLWFFSVKSLFWFSFGLNFGFWFGLWLNQCFRVDPDRSKSGQIFKALFGLLMFLLKEFWLKDVFGKHVLRPVLKKNMVLPNMTLKVFE
jgi:hypothetical protein